MSNTLSNFVSQEALRESGCHLDGSSEVELARELAEAVCVAHSDSSAGSQLLLPDGTAIQVSVAHAYSGAGVFHVALHRLTRAQFSLPQRCSVKAMQLVILQCKIASWSVFVHVLWTVVQACFKTSS